MDNQQTDMNGKVIASQFRISKLLGQGGMGSVYLAEQIEMGRQVVVKVMNPAQMGSADLEERFRREAKAVAQLNHPNVVQVYVFGRTDDGQLYLAMEFVAGHTLTQLLAERAPLPEARALRIMDQMCSALVEAHALGLIHRDLKPDNVMLTERHGTADYVKILDFGIAKMLDSPDAKLTRTGAIFGTPQYMAPEQASSRPVDQRTDIYALGLILYEMIAGQMPFTAPTAIEYLMKHVTEPVLPPTRKVSGLVLLPRTEAIVMKCLAKAPEDRFQSVSELQREVRMCLRDRPDAARSFPTPDEPRQPIAVARTAVLDGAAAPASGDRETAPAKKSKTGLVIAALASLAAIAVVAVAAVVVVTHGKGNTTSATHTSTRTESATRATTQPATDVTTGATTQPATDVTTAAATATGRRVRTHSAVQVATSAKTSAETQVRTQVAGGETPGGREGATIEGIPIPAETELMSSMPQALTLRSALDPAAIVAFYRRMGRTWGAFKEISNGLHFEDPKSPVTYLTVSRMAGGTMVSFVRNAMIAPPKADKARRVLGILMPPEAQATLQTPTDAVFQMPGSTDKVIPFFRKQVAGKSGVTATETEVNGSAYFVASVEGRALPFRTLAVMKTPDSLRPGTGDWVQISISK